MGLRSRLKGKIKETLEGVGVLAKVIHDEANHPGRPQPHMAARNPLWGGGEVDGEENLENSDSDEAVVQSTTQDAEAEPASPPTEEVDYWFLNDEDGEGDDWSLTNPKN
jgi:hypothetical protein